MNDRDVSGLGLGHVERSSGFGLGGSIWEVDTLSR